LPPEPAFHADLKAVGVDIEKRHFFAGQPQHHADRLLGRLLIQGFLNTLAGRSSGGVVLPRVSPAGMVEYIQRGFSMRRPDMHVIVQVVGETECRLLFRDTEPLPDFSAGMVEIALERARVRAKVTVADRQATSYALRIRW